MKLLLVTNLNDQDVTTRECSELAHVDTVQVTEYLDTVELDYNFYRGSCDLQLLSQQQQVWLNIGPNEVRALPVRHFRRTAWQTKWSLKFIVFFSLLLLLLPLFSQKGLT